jgi:hypothetical protein
MARRVHQDASGLEAGVGGAEETCDARRLDRRRISAGHDRGQRERYRCLYERDQQSHGGEWRHGLGDEADSEGGEHAGGEEDGKQTRRSNQ